MQKKKTSLGFTNMAPLTSRHIAVVSVLCLVVVGLHPTTYRTMLGQDADWDVKHWTPGPTLYLSFSGGSSFEEQQRSASSC